VSRDFAGKVRRAGRVGVETAGTAKIAKGTKGIGGNRGGESLCDSEGGGMCRGSGWVQRTLCDGRPSQGAVRAVDQARATEI
jgi:hypothetical protein